jgi:hypothetical protein
MPHLEFPHFHVCATPNRCQSGVETMVIYHTAVQRRAAAEQARVAAHSLSWVYASNDAQEQGTLVASRVADAAKSWKIRSGIVRHEPML